MKNNLFLVALLAIVMASCNQPHETTHDEDEEPKLQFTAYSPNFELFAEADPFVKGKVSNVLSHFSNLPDFSAVDSGSITLHLTVAGNPVSQTLGKPSRRGIFSFDIQPEIPGKGILEYHITTDKGDFMLAVPDIEVYATEEEADEAAGKIQTPKTNTSVFTKEQSWKIDFATHNPTIEPFGQVIKTTAQIQSAQGDEILVTAKANGIISFADNSIFEGKSVTSGQPLFSISGKGFADNNTSVRFAEARNNFEKATADYERAKELAKDRIVSEKELLQTKNQYENAKVVYDNLNINFGASGQRVSSPMSGFIKQLFGKNGQYVEAGQPVLMVSQNKSLLLHADIQQRYAAFLGAISTANIRTLNDQKTYTLEELNGKVLSYGRSANSDNYLLPLNIQIDNIGSFVPGGFVELYLKTITNSQALTLPNSALVEEQGNFYVFVQVTPELFEKREIKIGATDGIKTEIMGGISENDRIVTRGAILVKLAQSSGTLDAHSGHVH